MAHFVSLELPFKKLLTEFYKGYLLKVSKRLYSAWKINMPEAEFSLRNIWRVTFSRKVHIL